MAVQHPVYRSLADEAALVTVTRLYLRLAALVHLLRVRSDVRFIGFNRATETKLVRIVLAHCFANAMENEPCGILANAKDASEFITTDSVLGVRQHPDRNHPFVESKRRVLHDRSDLHRELLFADIAEPQTASLDERMLRLSAAGAGHFATQPTKLFRRFKCAVRITEEGDCRLKVLRSVHV